MKFASMHPMAPFWPDWALVVILNLPVNGSAMAPHSIYKNVSKDLPLTAENTIATVTLRSNVMGD